MSTEATPQEIYDTIRDVVQDNLNYYTKSANKSRELLSLLNGHRPVDLDFCDKDNPSEHCKNSWNDFWEQSNQYTDEELNAMCDAAEKADKVKKWVLPVELDPSGECFIIFPDDLLEAANLKEGDTVEWIDQGDGSFKIVKVTKPLGMDEC